MTSIQYKKLINCVAKLFDANGIGNGDKQKNL